MLPRICLDTAFKIIRAVHVKRRESAAQQVPFTAVPCRAVPDQHCMITWGSGGQAGFTPALWHCQEGRESCSLARSRVSAAQCWPCCRALLRPPCSGQSITAVGTLSRSLAVLPVAVLVSQRQGRASSEQKCSFHLWLRSFFSLPSLYFLCFLPEAF